jgi:hypothetical protein
MRAHGIPVKLHTYHRKVPVIDPHVACLDAGAAACADAAARTVLRLLAVGDIDIVWALLHGDLRCAMLDRFLATSYAEELLTAYGSRVHRAQFLDLARHWLLNDLGPLHWAEAERRARTVDTFAADDCVVVTLEVDGEPECRWGLEMTFTETGWRLRNVATYA